MVLVIQSSPAARWMMTRRHSHSSKRMRLWRESVVVQSQVVCPQSWGSETLSCGPALSSLSRNFRRTFPKRGRQRGVRALEPAPAARTCRPHLPRHLPQGSKPRPALHLTPALTFALHRLLSAAAKPPPRPFLTGQAAGVIASVSDVSARGPRHPRPRRHPPGTCRCWEPRQARGALTVNRGCTRQRPACSARRVVTTGPASACRPPRGASPSSGLRWRATSRVRGAS